MSARGPYEHKGVYTPDNLARVVIAKLRRQAEAPRQCDPECAPHLLLCCSLECELEELERRKRQ